MKSRNQQILAITLSWILISSATANEYENEGSTVRKVFAREITTVDESGEETITNKKGKTDRENISSFAKTGNNTTGVIVESFPDIAGKENRVGTESLELPSSSSKGDFQGMTEVKTSAEDENKGPIVNIKTDKYSGSTEVEATPTNETVLVKENRAQQSIAESKTSTGDNITININGNDGQININSQNIGGGLRPGSDRVEGKAAPDETNGPEANTPDTPDADQVVEKDNGRANGDDNTDPLVNDPEVDSTNKCFDLEPDFDIKKLNYTCLTKNKSQEKNTNNDITIGDEMLDSLLKERELKTLLLKLKLEEAKTTIGTTTTNALVKRGIERGRCNFSNLKLEGDNSEEIKTKLIAICEKKLCHYYPDQQDLLLEQIEKIEVNAHLRTAIKYLTCRSCVDDDTEEGKGDSPTDEDEADETSDDEDKGSLFDSEGDDSDDDEDDEDGEDEEEGPVYSGAVNWTRHTSKKYPIMGGTEVMWTGDSY